MTEQQGRFDLSPESRGKAPAGRRMAGRRIAVFGAGQDDRRIDDPPVGNGRAACRLVAREGATVFCIDRHLPAAEATTAAVRDEGGAAFAHQADVAEPEQIETAARAAVEVMGGLDGVLAVVGVARGAPWLAGIEVATWDAVYAINVRAQALIARAVLPLIDEGGALVFLSSVAAQHPGSRIPAYDSSKAALDGLVRHVAWEGEARGVRANLVAPGYIDTPNGRRATQFRPERAEQRLPFHRQGTGWEVAYACLFLLSNESAYINSQTLTVDGGFGALAPALVLPGQPSLEPVHA